MYVCAYFSIYSYAFLSVQRNSPNLQLHQISKRKTKKQKKKNLAETKLEYT